MSNWKTQKGDEWRYDNGTIHAIGDLNSAECAFLVGDITCSNREITEKHLLNFLRETKESFSESGIFIKQSRLKSSAKEVLMSLENKGLVCSKASDSPQSLIEVVSVPAKKWWSLW
ncbi:hypothetical protein MIB92_02025 [Aestuariirhabdus sp. Z084]|uniref:hypothetical protein n=1 Tax=Aestuariirhabdus haliotis TaxID=2918751 RepID=UPI00201B4384|nr:hypothetical protein [Aestuariirhabdus haliotis]MCL6414417.1 hypothetical protein [Aestuariirhabdus haliotis]MCL6418349.1 hypothetical protein [Aestuariirhabdus haliotis]